MSVHFLTAFIKSLGFKGILLKPDNEQSLVNLIERVTSNLTCVELVLMTFPEGDHQANRFSEVGVPFGSTHKTLVLEFLGLHIEVFISAWECWRLSQAFWTNKHPTFWCL